MPRVFVEAVDGHKCLCNACSPTFNSDLQNKLIRNIHREKQAELTDATKQRLVADMLSSLFTDDVFGITILQNSDHCDLSLAAHTFPQNMKITLPTPVWCQKEIIWMI